MNEVLWAFPKPDKIGVTMTAEISDAFRTRREGVRFILQQVGPLFRQSDVSVFSSDGTFISVSKAAKNPFLVASANWRSTGEVVSRFMGQCLLVDMGSTTTDIIPIKNGKVVSTGWNDRTRLISGELIYTGYLRTNVAHLVSKVPATKYRKKKKTEWISTSSEWFCCMGDVHLILRTIKSNRYTSPTPDGRPKTRPEALRRLARLICSDREELKENQLVQIAQYIYDVQKGQILRGMSQVRQSSRLNRSAPVVCLGHGRFTVLEICAKNGIPKKSFLSAKLPNRGRIDPSFSLAYLLGIPS